MLVDEQFGSTVPAEAHERGLKLAMPAERSGQPMFDFEYGDDFGEHIEKFNPDYTKVLVRYNPDGDADANREQLAKLLRLSDWLGPTTASSCSSCSSPPRTPSWQSVGGDTDRYDAELRPELMRRAIADIQDAGIVVDIWKIEGVDERSDCEMLVAQARTGGRDDVKCVVLGRGADDAKVDQWLTAAAPVDGYIGFAIGRSIWWDPLKAYVDGKIERSAGARKIAENYLRFVAVYERAKGRAPLSANRRMDRRSWQGRRSVACLHASERGRRQGEDAVDMKMRQSLAEWEQAFAKEASLDRRRRDSLRRTTEQRALKRELERATSAAPCASCCSSSRYPHRGRRHGRDVPHPLPAARLSASGRERQAPRSG